LDKIIENYLSSIGIYHSGRTFKRSCSILSQKSLSKDITLLQEMTLIFVQRKTTCSRPGHSRLRTYPRKQNSFDIHFIRFM